MLQTLLTILPNPNDLLALEPEDLGDVILEIAPGITQHGKFTFEAILEQVFTISDSSYPTGVRGNVANAIGEALSRLISLGLLIEDPEQPAKWYRPTRRAQSLKSRKDVEQFRKGRILPIELLQPTLAEKVWPLFLRGDHDVAVFQAFKEIEVAVRNAARQKEHDTVEKTEYPNDLVGTKLMRKAFHPEDGPLANKRAVAAEREAEMHLFSGAIGHAKNPVSHRDIDLPPREAARLVVLASHLLSIVEERL